MKRIFCLSLLAAALVLGMNSQTWARSKSVEVVVTNYTTAQPFSPIACVVHDRSFAIYELGEAANQALESIAEDAITDDLETLVASEPGAKTLVVGGGPIPPGGTDSVVVEMGRRDLVSCVWMLVNTNDTFSSITKVRRPRIFQVLDFHPIAFDAGTEVNDEQEESIPGPCCENVLSGMEEGGLVLGSPGIAGGPGSDLGPMYDWRGPVAAVVVRRHSFF